MADFERTYGRQAWRTALEPIPTLIDQYKAHKISGILLFAGFVIVKGYVLARGDITTAQGIVQYAGVASVVIAAALSSVPLLAAAMLAISCFQMVWPLMGNRRAGLGEQSVVSIGAFVLCTVVTRWPFTVAAIVFGFFFGLVNRFILADHNRHKTEFMVWAGIYVGSVSAAVAILYSVWLPNEIVTFKPKPNGRHVVAYVLAEDSGGQITLLTSGSRRIVSFRDKNVASVKMCRPTPHDAITDITNASTLWALFTSKSHWGVLRALQPAVPALSCRTTNQQPDGPGQSNLPH